MIQIGLARIEESQLVDIFSKAKSKYLVIEGFKNNFNKENTLTFMRKLTPVHVPKR